MGTPSSPGLDAQPLHIVLAPGVEGAFTTAQNSPVVLGAVVVLFEVFEVGHKSYQIWTINKKGRVSGP